MQKIIKFAHLADLHLGGWRENFLTQLNFITFQKSINKIIEEKCDFVIFAGDIFNNAMPPLELVNLVIIELMKLKKLDIPIYVIGGSHDYSHTGKSYIQLLDSADILRDVSKYTIIDKEKVKLEFFKDKSGAIISGILGKKNGLDKNIYTNLNENILSKENLNIFVFHTTLNDIMPENFKNIKSEIKSSYLPNGFDYYAGGHIHTHIEKKERNYIISYPGPLFPNNFTEMIKEEPSFNLCSFDFKTRDIEIKRIFLNTYQKIYIKINIRENSNSIDAKNQILEEIYKKDLKNKIVLLEIIGTIEGKIMDINLNEIVSKIYNLGAIQVLKNTYKLNSKKEENLILNKENLNTEEIEDEIIKQNINFENEQELFLNLKNLLKLELEKIDGEKTNQFEERIINKLNNILK